MAAYTIEVTQYKKMFVHRSKTIPGYKLSVQLLVPLSVCHKTKTKKNFLFFHGQSKRISEVSFVLFFGLKFVVFSCCFPQIPSIHLPLHSHRFPHICKFMQMEMLANTMLKFMRRIISIDNTK